jgi:hypothetical protein
MQPKDAGCGEYHQHDNQDRDVVQLLSPQPPFAGHYRIAAKENPCPVCGRARL